MATKTITQSERLALIGLLTVGCNQNQQLKEVEKAMQTLTGEQDGIGSGFCADALYQIDQMSNAQGDADHIIKCLKIEVTDTATA